MNLAIRIFVLVIIVPALLQACSGEIYILGKANVEIYNSLPGGVTLTVNSKSKDDDLGSLPMARGNLILRPIGGGTTLFFCSMQWPGQFHHFDIYVEKRDFDRCYKLCTWHIHPTGPCLHEGPCENWSS
ncbi:hypothetical protein ACJRO7_003952 [Eucalyptus globulus]|uniref:S-protein homolog n=1 Tax=Eucalyptus globulus TaxID=34317 RepID=A0ABD3IY01_EUCGL